MLYLLSTWEFLAGFSNSFIISGSSGLSEDRSALQTLNTMEMLSNNLCSLPSPPSPLPFKKINKMETPTACQMEFKGSAGTDSQPWVFCAFSFLSDLTPGAPPHPHAFEIFAYQTCLCVCYFRVDVSPPFWNPDMKNSFLPTTHNRIPLRTLLLLFPALWLSK